MGMSIGLLCMPARWRRPAKALLILAFVGLANVPDFHFHREYAIRHNVLVNAALMAVPLAILLCWSGLRRWVGGWAVIVCGAIAWFSHFLLDSFYSHGLGIAIFWPLSKIRFALPIPWFHTMKPSWRLHPYNVRVWSLELLCYGALLAACVLGRRLYLRGRAATLSAHSQ